GRLFAGLVLDPAGAVPDANRDNNAGFRLGTDFDRLTVFLSYQESADLIDLPAIVKGSLEAGETDYYRFTLAEAALVTALAAPAGPGLDPTLILETADRTPLARSDDRAAGDPAAFIAQHLAAGDYLLSVASRNPAASAGAYVLRLERAPSSSPVRYQ